MHFNELKLIEPLKTALDKAGYQNPTPIQEKAIPPALLGRDILGTAQTGTGKTAAFSLPILQRLDAIAGNEPVLRALILTPTRELAAQIGRSLETYGEDLDLYHAVIFGGVSDKAQIRELRRGVDILVATPGRLLDLMNRRMVSLERVEIFVLDEADRMLDMGFIHDVRRVIRALPKKRQTLLFSATMPKEIRELSDSLLSSPVSVSVAPVSATADRVEQHVYFTDKGNKRKLLSHVLRGPGLNRCLVFSRTKHGADRVARHLDQDGIPAAAIHGNKSQNARTRALENFSTGKIPVLVATDIAARGIDIDDITHVINFDLPNVPETYVHRIGRTARAGASGIALSFCDAEERAYLADIERLIKQTVLRVDDHPFPQTGASAPPPPPRTRGRGPGQGGKPSRSGSKFRRSRRGQSSWENRGA